MAAPFARICRNPDIFEFIDRLSRRRTFKGSVESKFVNEGERDGCKLSLIGACWRQPTRRSTHTTIACETDMISFRRLVPTAAGTRRAYSFFSSNSGGGRPSNSSKPSKVPTAKAATQPTSPTSPVTETPNGTPAGPKEQPVQSMLKDFSRSALTLPPIGPHPQPPLPSLLLHSFFSLHRPLLLLPNPVATLFKPPPPSHSNANAAAPEEHHDDPEADADTARMLSRAQVVHRVGSETQWTEVISRLGLETENTVYMDSVKRKRRKKISKHK